MATRSSSKVLIAVMVMVAAAAAGAPAAAGAKQDAPSSVVEDYALPRSQVDEIRTTYGISVTRGDGHLLPAPCGDSTIYVRRRLNPEICFEVNGANGWLALNVPEVYSVKATSRNLKATLTRNSDGVTKTYDIPGNGLWVSIGEGDLSFGAAALASIRTA